MGIYRHFPYTNFHEMNLDEIIKIVKQMLEDWAQYYDTWEDWKTQVTNEWSEMQTFINTYFDNLNVQTEINNKITAMVNSGEFSQIVDPYVPPAVASWLAEHITVPESVVIDDTLSIPGASADAKATGDAIEVLTTDVSLIGSNNVDKVIASQTVTGTNPWNASYVGAGITPQYGETYYLHVGSVTNCMTNNCARLDFRQGSNTISYIYLTVDDVANNRSVAKKCDSILIDNIVIILYRNASGETVASGSTEFTNVTLKHKHADTVSIANKYFDLTENDDYIAVINSIADTNENLDNGLAEVRDAFNSQFESNIVYEKSSQIVSGTSPYNGVYIHTGIKPVYGERYFLHIDKVENCLTPVCARINFMNGTEIYSYAPMTVEDVEAGIAISKVCDSLLIDGIVIVLFRNNSSATVESGDTTFTGVRMTTHTDEVTYVTATYWKDKKIAWFGTSIPAGSYDEDSANRYPNIVGAQLGATVYNESVGSSSISRTLPTEIDISTNPYGFDTRDFEYAARCLTNTITMQNWLIANYNAGFFTGNVPDTMDTATQNRILSYSYENKVDKYLPGGTIGNVDLYVFDHGYNEYYHNRDVEALETQYGIDTKYCFDGGMNFLIRRILTANPDAKIVIISHYTDNATDSIHNTTGFVEEVRDAQKAVCERWSIKFVNIFEKLGWSGQMITTTGYWDSDTHEWVNSGGTSQNIQIKDIHVRDTVHPYTDASGKSNHRIADVIIGEFESLIR